MKQIQKNSQTFFGDAFIQTFLFLRVVFIYFLSFPFVLWHHHVFYLELIFFVHAMTYEIVVIRRNAYLGYGETFYRQGIIPGRHVFSLFCTRSFRGHLWAYLLDWTTLVLCILPFFTPSVFSWAYYCYKHLVQCTWHNSILFVQHRKNKWSIVFLNGRHILSNFFNYHTAFALWDIKSKLFQKFGMNNKIRKIDNRLSRQIVKSDNKDGRLMHNSSVLVMVVSFWRSTWWAVY